MNFKEEDDGRVIVWRTGEDHSQPEKYDDQRIGGIDRRKDGKSNVQTESDTAAPVSYTHLDVYKRQVCGMESLGMTDRMGIRYPSEECSREYKEMQ